MARPIRNPADRRWQLGQVMQEVRALHILPMLRRALQYSDGCLWGDERLPIITGDASPAREQLALVQVRVEK